MLIIKVDNFDRELYVDVVVCRDVKEVWGKRIVEFLNDKYSGDDNSAFFKLVPDDHKLFKGFEP